jgi:general secretion pathway protein F/type IV pilus assembly protein PilC
MYNKIYGNIDDIVKDIDGSFGISNIVKYNYWDRYTGFDKDGKKIKSTIQATSLKEAKLKLKLEKIIYTNIQKDSFSKFYKLSFKKTYKISTIQLASISRDLSIYLESDISLINGIKLIEQRYKNDKKLKPFFQTIVTFLDEGKTFYTALKLQDIIVLPEFYLHTIRISEDGGMVAVVLEKLAIFLEEQYKINKQISSALFYPSFILIVAVFMVGFMLSFVVPKITSIFEQYDQTLPQITTIVINMGDFISDYYIVLILGWIILVFLFGFFMKKSYSFRYLIDKFLLKVPFFGSLIELNELSRFSYMNSILINSGVPIVHSFKLSANILKNSVIKKLFIDASNKVVEGDRLSKILDNSKLYKIDIAFIQAIAIGEETSKLSLVLQSLSKLYHQKNKDKITLMLSLLEPIFMLIVGSIIGVIVMAMLLPIFSMNFG